MGQSLNQEDITIQMEGRVTYPSGTRVLTIVIPPDRIDTHLETALVAMCIDDYGWLVGTEEIA